MPKKVTKKRASVTRKKKPALKESIATKKVVSKKTTATKTRSTKGSGAKTSVKSIASKKTDANKKTRNLAEQLLYGSKETEFRLVNQRTGSVERIIDRQEMESELALRDAELAEQYDAACRAKNKIDRWIQNGSFGSEVSCTVAFRKKFGHVVSPLRYLLEVHVPAKMSETRLMAWPANPPKGKHKGNGFYSVPAEVDGVLTKVVETQIYRTSANVRLTATISENGMVRLKDSKKVVDIQSKPAPSLASTEVIGGLPTGEANTTNWGTFGIAFSESPGKKSFGLINAHFADGAMVQPPVKPKSNDLSLWGIGFSPSNRKYEGDIPGENQKESFYVDAALIELNDKRSFVHDLVQDFSDDPFLYAETYLRHRHRDSNRRDVLKKVFKYGAKTRASLEGFIENPEDSIPLDGRQTGKVIKARRNGTSTYTDEGDSGSVLVAPIYDHVSKRHRFLVVGLCFAGVIGNKEVLYACHFAAVIKALKLKIPKNQLRKDWEYAKT